MSVFFGKDPKKMYCGAGKVPKGKVKGNAYHCAEKGQIRLYGLEQVSKEQTKQGKKEERPKLIEKYENLKRLTNNLGEEKGKLESFIRDNKGKEDKKQVLLETRRKLKQVRDKYNKAMEDKSQTKRRLKMNDDELNKKYDNY